MLASAAASGSTLLGALLLITAPALAQRPGLEVGVRAGPNRSTLTGSAGPIAAGFQGQIGAFLTVPMSARWAIRPELAITRKKVQFTGPESPCPAEGPCIAIYVPASETGRTTFTWVEVPLLAQFRLPAIGPLNVTPQLMAGPFLAVRLGQVDCQRFGPPTSPEELSTAPSGSCNEDYQPAGAHPASNGDAGFVLGGVLRRGNVGLGVRWTRSMVDAILGSPFTSSPLTGGRHSTLTLSVELATAFGR